MHEGILNELYELVVSTCDSLYANRQIITKNAVKQLILSQGTWPDAELEVQLPKYISDWRLNNLSSDREVSVNTKLLMLETQISKYQIELQLAKQTINQLQADLQGVASATQQYKQQILQQLRGMLDV